MSKKIKKPAIEDVRTRALQLDKELREVEVLFKKLEGANWITSGDTDKSAERNDEDEENRHQ